MNAMFMKIERILLKMEDMNVVYSLSFVSCIIVYVLWCHYYVIHF